MCPPSPGWPNASLIIRHQPPPPTSQPQCRHTWGRFLSPGAQGGFHPPSKRIPVQKITFPTQQFVEHTGSMQQNHFNSHKADRFIQSQNPTGRPHVPVVCLHGEATGTRAHTCHLEAPPSSHSHPGDWHQCTYPAPPTPAEGVATQWGSHEAEFHPLLVPKPSQRQPFCPPSLQQHNHTKSEYREVPHSPRSDQELCGSWVAIVGFTHSTPNRTTPGGAPEKYLPIHPSSSQ